MPVLDYLERLTGLLATRENDRARADALLLRVASGTAEGTADGALAAMELARLLGEAGDPVAAFALADPGTLSSGEQAVALVVSCFAAVRTDYPARQDATSARSALRDRADASYPAMSEIGSDLLDWIVRLVGESVLHLSAVAATRAPVVRVETGVSLPSTLLAFDLYADPSRAGELVERNRLGTPLVMPTRFEALAA